MVTVKIKFTKMHGLGNDFVVIDGRDMNINQIKRRTPLIAERRFGVGCDQVLVLRNSQRADFRMRIFNADGSEVEMCGNGIRCLAMFIRHKNISKKDEIRFETLCGIITTRFKGKKVDVDMGPPILEAPLIPVNLQGRVVDQKLWVLDQEFNITCVSMGNPHCVIFLDSLKLFDVEKYGPAIENHELFPNRINVEFVQVMSKKHLKVKVWERGTGRTLACGTGACASVVAARLAKGAARSVTVELAGGSLKVNWDGKEGSVLMTGPAETVYTGTIEL